LKHNFENEKAIYAANIFIWTITIIAMNNPYSSPSKKNPKIKPAGNSTRNDGNINEVTIIWHIVITPIVMKMLSFI